MGYMGDGFYRSKDPTNSIQSTDENATKVKENNENTYAHTIMYTKKDIHKISTTSPSNEKK